MSHAVYQTPALVLKTKNRGEANKLIWLYTKDFGLVYVTAQSIRAASAKMKSHIHKLSFIDADVVRGRDIWRLVGVHELAPGMDLVGTVWYPFFEIIAHVIARLCVDQEPEPKLWDLLISLRTTLPISEEQYLDIYEVYIVTQILSLLGYFDLPEELISDNPAHMTTDAKTYTVKNKRSLVELVNQAFVSSQL